MDILIRKQFAALHEGFQNAEIDFLIRPFTLPEKGGVFILFRKNIDFRPALFFGIVAPPASERGKLHRAFAGEQQLPEILLADFLKDAKLDDSGAVKGLAAEIDTLAKADATAFLFNTADGNAQQFKGMQPGAAGGKTPPAAGKEPKDMNYDELCAYLEANPGAKLE